MKKILWALSLMSAMTFADVHPALQQAIDTKNYKQAENLIKNVGIKDIYCPETLAAKDADKIYGKVFVDSIGYLLKNCDASFSRTYLEYKCANGKDKNMCLNLVNLTDPNSWPESYAKQFCTKKNVEICAAAVERIPIEKSVPYLKAIKANQLADMKGKNNTVAKAVSECRELCEMGRKFKLSGQIDNDIFRKRQEWRRATSLRDQQWIEQQIRSLEKDKIAIRSDDYCIKKCPGSSQSKSELEKFSHYYFERAFYALSHKVYLYYKNESNPIIPELAENWSIVDKLIDTSLDFFLKSVKDAGSQDLLNADLGLLNIILERQKELAKLYPYVITKRFVMDTLKASFANGKNIKESDQLFYCKIYPSLEKETEKLFGTKIINCKLLIEENQKILKPCHEGDLPLKDGKFHCVEGPNGWEYKRVYHEKRVGKYVVMDEHDSDTETQKCPEGWHSPSSKEMEYIKKNVVNQPISCLKNENEQENGECAEEAEGECFEEYCCNKGKFRKGSNLELTVGKICTASMQDSLLLVGEIGFLCRNNVWEELQGIEVKIGEKCNYKNAGLFAQGYVCALGKWREQTIEESATGKLCKSDNQGEFVGAYVCDENKWRIQTKEERVTGITCSSRTSNEFINGFVCRNNPNTKNWNWEDASKYELLTQMVCSSGNYGKKKNGYLCDENFGWIKDLNYGKIKDKRDGRVYRTIKIGKQEWMAENLGGESLYGFKEVVCPDGWEIPSKKDWIKMFKTIGGKEKGEGEFESVKDKLLAEKVGGSNEYGFTAVEFDFWTSTKSKFEGYDLLFVTLKPKERKKDDSHIGYLSRRGSTEPQKDKLDGEIIWFRADGPWKSGKHKVRCIKD